MTTHPTPQKLVRKHKTTQRNLTDRITDLHSIISSRYAFVHRMAVAVYDGQTDLIKTFISSNADGGLLKGYDAHLSEVPSLKQIAETRQSRIVSSINEAFINNTSHTLWLKEHNYQSSYTIPVYQGQELAAFLFFDSKQLDVFTEEVTAFLDIFVELTSQLYLLELGAVRSLIGTVQIASDIARIRDLETGQHLKRIANYSRLIALNVASHYGLDDEFIEYIHLFAPLHDIGKVGIPDAILLKPGRLDTNERQIIEQHVEIGARLVRQIIKELGLEEGLATRVMYNVVACHHERGNGSGYPAGLRMDEIPIEARIVAVADVYDALTCERPYKRAWSIEATEEELRREAADGRLDPFCVEALLAQRKTFEEIHRQFAE